MQACCKFSLCVWLWLLICQAGFAGSLTSPKGVSTQSLVINYTPDPDGSTSTGELTVTVTTATGGAANSDRNLEVILYLSSQFGKSIAYPVQITLSQGALSATAKIHYLQPYGYGQWVVDVLEDGQNIVRPKPIPSSLNNTPRKTWLEIVPAGVSQSSFQNGYELTSSPNVDGLTTSPALVGLPAASADWRTYLAYDAVAVPQSQLSIASPAQIQALNTYILAGGNLVVHSADDSARGELDRLMGSIKDASAADFRWEKLSPSQEDLSFKRSHGAGQMIVSEKPSPAVNEHLQASIQFPVSDFALCGDTDFRWFWRNLVQSVGTAPVWGFILFVTVFVILVGPVVLRLTTRMQHRTLLLFLVPALSLLATLLVLLYNVLREGFGTYGRIACVQFLDTNTGQGFIWSRQSYFSGAPPRDGLRFPLNTFLKPVEGETLSARYFYDPRDYVTGVIRCDGESQIFSNWLLPRNQQQVLVGQRSDQAKMPIQITRISQTSINVTNLTDQTIPLLFLRESIQVCYFAKNLQSGQSQQLMAETASVIDSMLKVKADYEPVEPTSIDLNSMRYYGYYYNNRNPTSDPMDNSIRKLTCSRLNDMGYWILLEQLPGVQLPFEPAVYSPEKHFHIMTGVSQW